MKDSKLIVPEGLTGKESQIQGYFKSNLTISSFDEKIVNDILFNQEESDKELLNNKRIRKLFLLKFKEESKTIDDSFERITVWSWFNEKLKELE